MTDTPVSCILHLPQVSIFSGEVQPDPFVTNAIKQFQIRPGAILFEGRAAAQGANLPGGQIQKFLLNKKDLLPVK